MIHGFANCLNVYYVYKETVLVFFPDRKIKPNKKYRTKYLEKNCFAIN